MPIVFVHGVNNRQGDEYQENEVARNAFLKEIVGPALGLTPDAVRIWNPYWGGDGVRFRWDMAVLPDAADNYEKKFGAGSDEEGFGRTVELASEAPRANNVVELARKDFPAAVDLLYAASMTAATNEDEARDLAKSYGAAMAYARAHPSPTWLNNVTDNNFADVLNAKSQEDGESFGAGGVLDSLKEGLSRLVHAVPAAASDLAVRMGRKKLNASIARFTGDAFEYLTNRGTKNQPGKIVREVLNDLRSADAARKSGDDKLVVISHSFGGEICYEIFSHYAPELKVDCWITVGSQVGLFQEMDLYNVKLVVPGANKPPPKMPRPANVVRWLNVFDTNDILSYRVEPVFDQARDFLYETGYSTLQAHSGYFMRPSFYERLAARLTQP
jgi:hypothetical protein